MCKRLSCVVGVFVVLTAVGAVKALEPVLKVDVGREPEKVAQGFVFVGVNQSGHVAEPFIVADVNGTGIGLQLETTYPGDMLGFRTEFRWVPVALYGSFAFVDDYNTYGIIMLLTNLAPGLYTVESYHNCISDPNSTPPCLRS